MKTDDIIRELKRISIDNHRCFGCGREHSCSTRGCAIMRAAADRLCELEQIAVQAEETRVKLAQAAAAIDCLVHGGESCDICTHKPKGFVCELFDYGCQICEVESCVCKQCNGRQKFIWEGALKDEA